MPLQDILQPESFLLGLHAGDKWDAIERMMAHLQGTGCLDPILAGDVLEAVLARERSMSTGMEHGLAIPHAAVDGLEEVLACLAVVEGEQGIPFESIDRSPTHVIVLLLIPRSHKLLHIRTLANIARVLGREEVRSALMCATTPEEARAAISETVDR